MLVFTPIADDKLPIFLFHPSMHADADALKIPHFFPFYIADADADAHIAPSSSPFLCSFPYNIGKNYCVLLQTTP
jgi:hypothetical protein